MCSKEGCDAPAQIKGMCRRHYKSWWATSRYNARPEVKERNRLWREENPERKREHDKKSYAKHRTKRIAAVQRRLRENPQAKLAHSLRVRLNHALRAQDVKKHTKMSDLVGCSIQDLKLHLESLFQEGMSWQERCRWHIDHILPLNSFDLSDEEQLKKAMHYTNLIPMWPIDNLSKGKKTQSL